MFILTDATRSETLNYTYDELNRLSGVSGAYSQNFAYNAIGNITNKNGTGYTYGDADHKHAVTSVGANDTNLYDANGNMTTRAEGGQSYTQTFDAENRLASVTVSSQTTQFVYDGDGNLVKKIKPDGTCTIYPSASLPLRGLRRAGIGGVYEAEKAACGGAVTHTTTYYPAGGAMRVDSTLYFVLKDHLGSASVVTYANGNVVDEQRYLPFGESRLAGDSMPTDRLFTGQREMEGLGIYHFGARFYSQKLGRFLSADTIVPDTANPQALNRYSYVLNRAVSFIDPTGNMPACGVYGAACEPDPKPKSATQVDEPWIYSKSLTASFHIGPTGAVYTPDYNSGYTTDRMVCVPGAPWTCILNLLAWTRRFPIVVPQNPENNLWVSLDVTYDESKGITLSNIIIQNYYNEPATLSSVSFTSDGTTTYLYMEEFQMPQGFGSDFNIPSPPDPFSGEYPITITIEVGYVVHLPLGPSKIYPDFQIYLPSLPDAKYVNQTGEISPLPRILP